MAFQRPLQQDLRDQLTAATGEAFNYSGVGQSRKAERPEGYALNFRREAIGAGAQAFEAACEAVRAWEMFGMKWVELCWPQAPIEDGAVVGVLAQRFGLWSFNPCRVIYTLEEDDGQVARYGFGYGTLPGHVMRGEERFLVEWDRETDEVTYEIYAFARPAFTFSWLILPILLISQRQFASASVQAMRDAIQ